MIHVYGVYTVPMEMAMMRKEIYISDAAAELIDEVQQLADGESLSSVIVTALRNWVENKRRTDEGFELREIQQGKWPSDGNAPLLSQSAQFIGRILAEGGSPDGALWTIYQTRSRKYVVVRTSQYGSDEEGGHHDGKAVSLGVYDDLDLVPHHPEDPKDLRLNLKTFGDLNASVPYELWDVACVGRRDLEAKWVD
jgi:hypothetical protein